MDPFLNDVWLFFVVCVKQEPAVGQPPNLQTLPFCLLACLLVVASSSLVEARIRRAKTS
jgi:uncharacterized membrane protein